MAFPQ
jgi:LysR family glycine cleavage system transcriptional activator